MIGRKSSGFIAAKTGRVVKEGDDLMCATRYALMMLRLPNGAKLPKLATQTRLPQIKREHERT